MKTYNGKFKIVERWSLNNSVNGNPKFACLLKDSDGELSQFRTQTDASCGYAFENYKIGSVIDIDYHITRSGINVIERINNHW